MATLEFIRKHAGAKAPLLADPSDLNVFACLLSESKRPIKKIVSVRATVKIPTGIAVRPPPGRYALLLTPKGLAAKSLWVASQTIDANGSAELEVFLYNGGYEPFYIEHEDLIAHILVLPSTHVDLKEVGKWA